MVCTEVEVYEVWDEIAEYEDLQSVGSSETVWHLMGYPIARKYPVVQALRVHLEREQQVNFDKGQKEAALETGCMTELTAFFKINKTLPSEDQVQYVDIPKKF